MLPNRTDPAKIGRFLTPMGGTKLFKSAESAAAAAAALQGKPGSKPKGRPKKAWAKAPCTRRPALAARGVRFGWFGTGGVRISCPALRRPTLSCSASPCPGCLAPSCPLSCPVCSSGALSGAVLSCPLPVHVCPAPCGLVLAPLVPVPCCRVPPCADRGFPGTSFTHPPMSRVLSGDHVEAVKSTMVRPARAWRRATPACGRRRWAGLRHGRTTSSTPRPQFLTVRLSAFRGAGEDSEAGAWVRSFLAPWPSFLVHVGLCYVRGPNFRDRQARLQVTAMEWSS